MYLTRLRAFCRYLLKPPSVAWERQPDGAVDPSHEASLTCFVFVLYFLLFLRHPNNNSSNNGQEGERVRDSTERSSDSPIARLILRLRLSERVRGVSAIPGARPAKSRKPLEH